MPKVSFLSLVSSDGALYNIDPTTVKVKRRIQLANISRLSASLLSDNFFVVHVPLEYDYLFVSGRKTEIISVLRQAFTEATSQELSITMQNMYVVPCIMRARVGQPVGNCLKFPKILHSTKLLKMSIFFCS